MNIDAESLMQEVAQQAGEAAKKIVSQAGMIGFLTKRVAELEAQLAAKEQEPPKESDQ